MPNHCFNLSGNDDKAYGQCQEVEFLDLRGVDISPECAAEIYARRENKWKKFKVDKTFNVIMELFSKYDVQSFKTDYVSFSPDELDEIKYESYVQSALVLAPGIFSCLCLIVQIIRNAGTMGARSATENSNFGQIIFYKGGPPRLARPPRPCLNLAE